MNRRLLSFALALLFCVAVPFAAHGQIVEIYAQSVNTHFSNVPTGAYYNQGGTYSEQYGSFFASGVGGGLTFNVVPVGPLKLGVDFRGSTVSGTDGYDTAMGGLKLAFKAPGIKPHPYLQASGGYLATRTHNVSTTSTGAAVGGTVENQYAGYEVFAGLDYPLLPFLDARIEAGMGQAFNTSINFTTPSTVMLYSVNPGLVVHF